MSTEELAAEAFQRTNFSAMDWGIVAIYLAVSLAIGLAVKRYATSMENYIGAGRSLGTWLGVATMTGTELGLVTVMYSAQKGFKFGFSAFHIALLAGMATLLVGLTGFIVVPLRRLRVLTIPEYYERRYDRRTRIVGGIVLAFAGILNMGMFLKVGSYFIVGLTGLPQNAWSVQCVVTVLLALVLIYTVLGGMISVVLTDYVQFVLLSIGLLGVSLIAIARLGWANIFAAVETTLGPAGFDPLADSEQAFGGTYVVWMAIQGLVACAIWPTAVARALAMESPAAVRKQYLWSSISFTIRFLIPYFWGICALVFITQQAPDLRALFLPEQPEAEPLNALLAMPAFLGRLLPMGVVGLLAAAMIAAFMSTHDSYLLCWSSVITQDVVAPLWGELSVGQRVRLTRILIVVIGIFLWSWGLIYPGGEDVWDYMAITGAIYSAGAIALLGGGLYWRRASARGALAALIAGCSAICALTPIRLALESALLPWCGVAVTAEQRGTYFTDARVGLASVGLTVVTFVAVSLLFPDPPKPASREEPQP